VARFEAVGAVVAGELWVMGGFIASTLEVTRRVDIYDPRSDTWRAGPDLPGAQTHVAAVTVDGDILLIGGFDGAANAWTTTPSVWRWHATDANWTVGPALPTRRATVAAARIGSEVHIAGGLDVNGKTDFGNHLVWDLAGAETWTEAAPLAEPRNHGGGAASGGLFFAIAGRHDWDEASGDSSAVDAFDPATGRWTARAPLPLARSEIGAATSTLPDGRLLVVGGSIAGSKPTATVLIYEPTVDSWSPLSSLPERRKGAVAASLAGSIIVTTGSPTSTDPSATTFIGCCL